MLKLTTNSLPAVALLAFTALVGTHTAGLAQDRPAAAAARDTVTVVACVTREADYARSTRPDNAPPDPSQLLLMKVDAAMATYSLTGVREPDLAQHIGQRVEVTGTVEPVRAVAVLTTVDGRQTGSINTGAVGAVGTTPGGGPAHEPGDALTGTVRTGAVNTSARATAQDPAYDAATIPRLNVTAFRRVAGTCVMPPPEAGASTAQAATPEQAPARPAARPPAVRQPQPITATGCLVRQTPSGSGETAQNAQPGEALMLTTVSLPSTAPAVGVSAVPGSVPSGSGTGTVRESPPPSIAPADPAKRSLVLAGASGQLRELTQHVGRRVEIVGVIERSETTEADRQAARAASPELDRLGTSGRVEPGPSVAHPSAQSERMTVTSFRAIGGACNN